MALIGAPVTTFAIGPAAAGVGPDVVISELMVNPQDVYDSRGEWIELVNRGDEYADLEGWTLTDGRSDHVLLPDLRIDPGERLVLARTADPYDNGGADPDWVYGNHIVLYNPGDRLILTDDEGVEHARVDWYPESGITIPDGRSIALRDPSLDGSLATSWCVSTTVMMRGDLGSPGEANICDATDTPLVITEILQNPRLTSDYVGEFFEVFNPGDQPVDMTGWTIKDDDIDRFTVDTALVVAPGGYSVFGINATGNGQVQVDYAYGGAMRLFNDYDELVVADERGILVDRTAWNDGLTFPDPNGASMSLLDPDLDNSVGASWCTATTPWAYGDKGTPGAPTWCVKPGDNPIVVTEIMFDPETPRSERPAEWFELANLGDEPIDLTGWTVTAGDWKVHTFDGLVIHPGMFAIAAASDDPVANGGLTPDYTYGVDPELPLYNNLSRIVLKNANGVIVDRVDWSADRGFPIPSGRSITLGFPSADNARGPNWCESTTRWLDGDFGTPGALGICEAPPAPAALSINEIMRNPAAVSDSHGEWLEIRNPTASDVDLFGWSVGDDGSDHHVIRASVIVPAHGFTVLGRKTDTTQNGGATVAYSYGDSLVLNNRDDEVLLHDQYGQPVDAIRWDAGETWIRPNGASMARSVDGWCISGPQFGAGDLGTPGATNDCTPTDHPDVVISETHINPAAVSDTVGEWFEITNASDGPVDIEGWQLRDDDVDRHTISTGAPWVLQPGEAVALGRDLSADLNGGASLDYSYGADFPILNSEDEITLLDADLVWVDRVTWTATTPLPAASGISASLRELHLDNRVADNWCSSVSGYGDRGERGTPGQPNLCEAPPVAATTTTTIVVVGPPPVTTVPGNRDSFVRVTAMCDSFDGDFAGMSKFAVQHESGLGPLPYLLQTGDQVLHEGAIGVAEVQYVWLPTPSNGVTVVPADNWNNLFDGTASSTGSPCASDGTTTTGTTTTSTTVPDATTSAGISIGTSGELSERHGFGLLALADPACSKGLKIEGEGNVVLGNVRSNGDVELKKAVTISGIVSYGGDAKIDDKAVIGDLVHGAQPVVPALAWAVTDFAPGGVWSSDPSWTAHDGDLKIEELGLAPGIYYVEGDVKIDHKGLVLTGVSIIATGKIEVKGPVTMSPFRADVPTLMTSHGTKCTDESIKLHKDNVVWTGLVVAPNGRVKIDSKQMRGDSVIGATIELKKSDSTIG